MLTLRTTKVDKIDHGATGLMARHARKSAKKTLRNVAGRMGYSAAYLSDLELGRRAWSAELIEKFKAALR